MKSNGARDQALYAFGVLTPGVVILLARFLGSGPADASAAITASPVVRLPDPQGQPATLPEPLDLAWKQAQAWQDRFLPESPFAPADRINQPSPARGTPAASGSRTGAVEPPRVVVSSIAIVGGRPLAVVDGQARRIGEPVTAGWWIENIDPQARVITLRHESGEQGVLRLAAPNDRDN